MNRTLRVARLVFTTAVTASLGSFLAGPALAGGFTFAGEDNGFDVITHPNGYTGTGGVVTVTVCVDPTSADADEMEASVQNAIHTWNDLEAAFPNLFFGSDNEIPALEFDFESVVLHEIGHCIGLAHPNLGGQAGVTITNLTHSTDGADDDFDEGLGTDGVPGSADDVRGDDVNLHWFRMSDNIPFFLGTIFDATTYSRDLGDLPGGSDYAANASRELGTEFGLFDVEAVMQQEAFPDEDQRKLAADDVATLGLGMSGLDEIQGTADDYTIELEYIGQNAVCDIKVDFDNSETGFAACSTGGFFLGDHVSITTADIFFNSGFSWFFTETVRQIFSDGFETGATSEWTSEEP